MTIQERLAPAIGALVAIVLQILLAPHIALFGAVPNFIVAYAVAMAIARPSSYGCVMPFVLGLFYDLFTGSPVGIMALSLMACTVLVARLFSAMDNDTLFMPLVVMAAGVFLVDFLYGLFLVLFGYPAGFVEVLAYRIVPCFVYDFVIAFVLYMALRRLLAPPAVLRTDITQLR